MLCVCDEELLPNERRKKVVEQWLLGESTCVVPLHVLILKTQKESNFRWSIAMMANNGHCTSRATAAGLDATKQDHLSEVSAKTDHQWWRGNFQEHCSSCTRSSQQAFVMAMAAALPHLAIDQRFDHSFLPTSSRVVQHLSLGNSMTSA